jgi:hypothetical protein
VLKKIPYLPSIGWFFSVIVFYIVGFCIDKTFLRKNLGLLHQNSKDNGETKRSKICVGEMANFSLVHQENANTENKYNGIWYYKSQKAVWWNTGEWLLSHSLWQQKSQNQSIAIQADTIYNIRKNFGTNIAPDNLSIQQFITIQPQDPIILQGNIQATMNTSTQWVFRTDYLVWTKPMLYTTHTVCVTSLSPFMSITGTGLELNSNSQDMTIGTILNQKVKGIIGIN